MIRRSVALLLTGSLLLGNVSRASDIDAGSEAPNTRMVIAELGLVGKWTATQFQIDGVDQLNKPERIEVEFKSDGTLLVWFDQKLMEDGRWRIDPTKRPAWFTVLPTNSNRYPPGIYRLSGDHLTIALGSPYGKRPKGFQSEKDEMLLIFQRKK